MNYLERAIEYFKEDQFAYKTTGIRILEADEGRAVCSLEVEDFHMNNHGGVMGGAIYTLTDFAFGIAANTPVNNCVTLSSTLNFLRPTAGPVLYAEAKETKNGRTVCFYDITVKDSEGKLIATAQFNGFRGSSAYSGQIKDNR